MSKKLDELVASQAGVSQSELEEAFLSLATLGEELEVEEATLETARATKDKARIAYEKAKDRVRAASSSRDPVFLDHQRASWIVRNADPDQPVPPTGIQPPRVGARRVS